MRINTVADAVAVLSYLHARQLLCDKCGDKLATLKNQFQQRCEGCRAPHAQYDEAKAPNELEKRIGQALNQWVTENPAGE